MERYWRLKNIPELRDVAPKYRREWWREATLHGRTWRTRLMSASAVGAGVLSGSLVSGGVQWPRLTWAVTYAIVAGALTFAVHHWCVQPQARRWLRDNLPRDGRELGARTPGPDTRTGMPSAR